MKAFTHVDGYMYFHGENYNLSLTFPAAPTSEVQTITLSQTNNAGYYALEYKGRITNALVYNASASTMAAAVNALPSIIEDGLTVSFNQAVSAGASVTATFTPGGTNCLWTWSF